MLVAGLPSRVRRRARRFRWFSGWPLATAISVTVAGLLVTLLIFTLATYHQAMEDRRRVGVESAVTTGRTLAAIVDGFAENVQSTTVAVALALESRASLTQDSVGPYLAEVARGSGVLRALFLTDPRGRVIATQTGRDLGRDLSDRPYVKALQAGMRDVWSDRLIGLETQQVTVAHARVVRGPDLRPRAFLVAAFFPERVLERLPFTLPVDARVTILDRNAQVLYASQGRELTAAPPDYAPVPEVREALAGRTAQFYGRRTRIAGEARFGVIAPASQTGWVVSFTMPVSRLEASLRAAFLKQTMALVGLALLAGVLAAVSIGRLTRPLGRLARTAAAVALGQRPPKAVSSGPREVTQLAEAMTVMSRAVAQREGALRRSLGVQQELYRLTDVVNRARTLDEVAEAALDALQATTGAARAALLLLDDEGIMRFVAFRGLSDGYRAAVEGHSPWPLSVNEPQPVVIEDLVEDASLGPRLRGIVADEGIRSLAFVPLISGGRLIGKLMLYRDQPHRFVEDEMQLARTIATNVTLTIERQRRAQELAGAYSAEQAARKDAEDARSRLAFLAEASGLLASSLDASKTFQNLARLAVPRIADWCIIYGVQEDGSLRRVEVAHRDVAVEGKVKATLSAHPPTPSSAQHARSLREGRVLVIDDLTGEWIERLGGDASIRDLLREMDLRSMMIVPLTARGELIGAIMFATSAGRVFGPEDRALAEELARRAGVAMEHARMYERERSVSGTLQQAFLPDALPQVPGATLHATYLAGERESEVGGDWYDAFWLPDGRLGLSIGDVIGRGLQAAVTMGQIRQGIRVLSEEGSPAAALRRVGRLLHFQHGSAVASVLFGVLDPADGTFTYANAGHPPPVLAEPHGDPRLLGGGGLPLGFSPEGRLGEGTLRLGAGTLLILYTDGLTEIDRHPLDGERRLRDAVREEMRHPSGDRARGVADRVLAGRQAADDVAVLTVTLAAAPVSEIERVLPASPSALALVRQQVRQVARGLHISDERLQAIQVAVGEAVNNVIEHAYGVPSGTFRVRVAVEDHRLVVEVQDFGRWRARRTDRGGRGLAIMKGLVDRATVVAGEHGTTVRLEALVGELTMTAGAEPRG
jgi:GAF domain-containing protein/anti-sigma regulatory factor (Ser/Thr protein kinase)